MSKREEKLELQVMCNAKVTSRCCVTSLLSDDSASRELGATLGFNLAIYKVSAFMFYLSAVLARILKMTV